MAFHLNHLSSKRESRSGLQFKSGQITKRICENGHALPDRYDIVDLVSVGVKVVKEHRWQSALLPIIALCAVRLPEPLAKSCVPNRKLAIRSFPLPFPIESPNCCASGMTALVGAFSPVDVTGQRQHDPSATRDQYEVSRNL